ncbi:MAG: hypothetical protein ABI806_03080 [Candidatus Solibacter sp.]
MSILIACASASGALASDPALELAPPDTKAVFGLRVKGIVESELFQGAAAGAPQMTEEWLKLVALAGFDPLHDIDEVLIAASGDKAKADALVILRGRFNFTRLSEGAPREQGIPLLGGKNGSGVMAVLNPETAILGDAPAVRAAIARRGRPSRLSAAVAARIQSLSERFDVWGFGDRPQGFASPAGGQELDGIDRFEFGLRLTDGFEIAADLHSRTPKDAEKLAASLGSVSAMLGMAGESAPKLNLTMKDGSVKFSLAISQEEIKKVIAARMAAPQSAPPALVVKAGPPTIIGGDAPAAASAPAPTDGGTTVFILPGKK